MTEINHTKEYLPLPERKKCTNPDIEWICVILPDGTESYIAHCKTCDIFTDHGIEFKKESE